jgi:hypothetical protein
VWATIEATSLSALHLRQLAHAERCSRRLKVFGVEEGRKEFEKLLSGCNHGPSRLLVYQDWLASAQAARQLLSSKENASARDRLRCKALTDEEARVSSVASTEFPDEACATTVLLSE